MLDGLKTRTREEQRGLLAKATIAMYRDPVTWEFRLPETGHLQELVFEGAHYLNIDIRNLRDRDRMRLARLFSSELNKLVIEGNKRRAAHNRLGQKGLLRLANYRIKGSDHFRDQSRRFGINQREVMNVIREPTSYQHLVSKHKDVDPPTQFTLFTKYFWTPDIDDLYWILTIARRERSLFSIVSAWRVYFSDLNEDMDLSTATPLDLLRTFVETFGLPIRVSDSPPRKFILYKRIPLPNVFGEIKLVGGSVEEGTNFTTQFFFRNNSEPPSMDIAIAFCINDTMYKSALKNHGAL